MATTIKDVAKYAGVGIGTVSRVLNGEKAVNDGTRERVLKAMTELEFQPNKMAAKLRRNETRVIALLVPVVNHPFFAKLANYVEEEADKFGYSMILVSSQQRVEKEKDIIDRIRRREVDGAVFVTHYAHEAEELKNCPIVSIDRPFGKEYPYVTSDNYSAAFKAVEYLLERGCKKIGYGGSKPIVVSEVMERERAYRDVMKKHGMPEIILNEAVSHGEEKEVVESFFKKYGGVDGVFASGYTMAQVLYETAMQRGISIPDELQIISYDGAFRQWNNNRLLTCVEQPIEEMAREAVKLLINRIRGQETPERVELKTSFVIGATTK